jgi:3-mercaptopyruvate sulfurtransferase SseA
VRDFEDIQKNIRTQQEQVVDVREVKNFVGGGEETAPGKERGNTAR